MKMQRLAGWFLAITLAFALGVAAQPNGGAAGGPGPVNPCPGNNCSNGNVTDSNLSLTHSLSIWMSYLTGGANPNLLASTGLYDYVSSITLSGSTVSSSNSVFYGDVNSIGGTFGSEYIAFQNFINGYSVNQTGSSGENTRVYTNFGGANQVGGFNNFDTTLFIASAITNDTGNQFYQAINVDAVANVNVGGSSGTHLGHLFSSGHYAHLESGATNWWSVSGDEYDISIDSGASANLATGVSVILLGVNAVSTGFGVFPAFLVGAQSGATATITCGLCFGGYEAYNGLTSGASVISYEPHGGSGSYPQATIAYGIDLNLFATTSYAWRGPNATSLIDGSGNATFVSTNTPLILNGGSSINIGKDSTHNGFLFVAPTGAIVPVIQAYSSVNTNETLGLEGQGTSGVSIYSSTGGSIFTMSQDGAASATTDYLQLHATSGSSLVYFTAAGSDSAVSITYIAKGSGSVQSFGSGGDSPNSGNKDFEIDGGNTPTSWLTVNGSATSLPTLGVHGTNVGIAFSPNGTGLINITNSASFVAASNCGSLTSSTGCLAIKDNNGNTVYMPVYGTL